MAQAQTQTIGLSQDQRQIQTLAPQLRQSLELLQVPLLELRTLIQSELQQNPTLEEISPDSASVEIEPIASTVDDGKELNFKEEFEILSRIDDEWCQYFMQQSQESEPYDADDDKRRSFMLDTRAQPSETLQYHLLQQLELAGLSEADRAIGEMIVGSINDDGYLAQSADELSQSTGIDAAHMKDILALVQDFDPIGVGAHDLKECLLLQLERLGQGSTPAALIIRRHLDRLAAKEYKEIAAAIGTGTEEVRQAAKLIATLEPKPGRAFSAEAPAYVMPDLFVEKLEDNRYVVILNDDQLPHLRISKQYKELMGKNDTTTEVTTYIRDRIRSGQFLIRSIFQRQQTLSKVANEIVKVQTLFLDHGISHLAPLTMSEVAAVVGIHETTVCRCIANKYMKTPRGLFEMKYFFTPGLKTADGKSISNKTVQDKLQSLIADEDPEHPLSDQDIQDRLKADGIDVARRTVAKYRIALKIPPSHERKTR